VKEGPDFDVTCQFLVYETNYHAYMSYAERESLFFQMYMMYVSVELVNGLGTPAILSALSSRVGYT
jgi:hypothetical protein